MKIHKKSIKYHLLFSLSLLITVVLLTIGVSSFLITKYESREIFDSSLVRTAKLLLSLTKHEIIEHEIEDNFIIDLGLVSEKEFHPYENKIHFQIWKRDNLIYNSSTNISKKKPKKEGFASLDLNNIKWRVFVIYDEESRVTIEVMENEDIRKGLISKILLSILLPILISFIPLLFIVWLIINRSLITLTLLSRKIRKISPLYLKPFDEIKNLPSEIVPLVKSLNFLMIKLEESMNKERKFIKYASHELRTPLTIIKTKTQFLIKKHIENKELKSDLDQLLTSIDRIINLSNQLLILTRIDIENKDIEKKNIDLSNLITKIIGNFTQIASVKNITFEIEVENKYFINANIFHVEILLNNLIDNAIKYSPENQKIFIKLEKNYEKDNNYVILAVKNYGDVILKKDQGKIFDRFYRIDPSNPNGSGLGLSIVRKISDLNDFKIKLISEKNYNEFQVIFNL